MYQGATLMAPQNGLFHLSFRVGFSPRGICCSPIAYYSFFPKFTITPYFELKLCCTPLLGVAKSYSTGER